MNPDMVRMMPNRAGSDNISCCLLAQRTKSSGDLVPTSDAEKILACVACITFCV